MIRHDQQSLSCDGPEESAGMKIANFGPLYSHLERDTGIPVHTFLPHHKVVTSEAFALQTLIISIGYRPSM